MLAITALIQCTWGILQTLVGFVFFCKYGKCKHVLYKGSILTYVPDDFGGVSLGLFIFVNKERSEEWTQATRAHEYGHTFQSLLLGPLYLFVIGLPSAVWCNNEKFRKKRKEENISYYEFYTESWANFFGTRFGKPDDREALKREIIGGRK